MSIVINGVAPLLQVYDMQTSVRFYRDVLGCELLSTSEPYLDEPYHWCLFRWGNAEFMLNTRYEGPERPPSPDPALTQAHSDTALFFGCPDVDAAYEILTQRGLLAEPPKTAPYGMRQLNFKDPDGYGICLQWPAQPAP